MEYLWLAILAMIPQIMTSISLSITQQEIRWQWWIPSKWIRTLYLLPPCSTCWQISMSLFLVIEKYHILNKKPYMCSSRFKHETKQLLKIYFQTKNIFLFNIDYCSFKNFKRFELQTYILTCISTKSFMIKEQVAF